MVPIEKGEASSNPNKKCSRVSMHDNPAGNHPQVTVTPFMNYSGTQILRVGNLILTALTIGRVPLINATKRFRICTRPSSFDTHLSEWASANFQPWNRLDFCVNVKRFANNS